MKTRPRLTRVYGAFATLSLAFAASVVVSSPATSAVATPRISISSASIVEGDAGTRTLTFLVALSAPGSSTVSATYSTADGSAHGGSTARTSDADYVTKSLQTLTFSPGQVAKYVSIMVIGDTAVEGNETFTVNLSNVVGATVQDSTGTGTIIDDDANSGFRIGVGDTTFREGDATLRSVPVAISFSGPAPSAFTLDVSTTPVTATGMIKATEPSADFVLTHKSIAVKANTRLVTFHVPTVPDAAGEPDETFTVNVTATIGTVTRPTGTVTILDDGDPGRLAWAHSVADAGQSVKVDASGNAYVLGSSSGVAVLRKYDPAGVSLWATNLSAGAGVVPYALSLDPNGGEAVVGYAQGNVTDAPETNAGGADAVVARYDSVGALSWVHDLGSAQDDRAVNVNVDGAGNVYVSGTTTGTLPGSPETNGGGTNAFVAKYDAAGTRQWVHQLGPSVDNGFVVSAVDSTADVIIGGYTSQTMSGSAESNAGGEDVFLAKYDTTGARLWVHDLGSSALDDLTALAVDGAGDTLVTGFTAGTLPGSAETNAGDLDAFIAKYDASGTRTWLHQLGGSRLDEAFGIAVDASGNAAITGTTYGSLPGAEPRQPMYGSFSDPNDMFVALFDGAGNRTWVHRLYSIHDPNINGALQDEGDFVAFDASGDVYVAGTTSGPLQGSPDFFGGPQDSFVVKYDTSGTRVWVHQFDGGGFCNPSGLAIGADGGPTATGYSTSPITPDPGGSAGSWVVHYLP